MTKRKFVCVLVAICCSIMFATMASGEEQRQWSRSNLWDPNPIQMVDTSKFKKEPPWVIGFSNAGQTNAWTVFMQREAQAEAERHPDLIKKIYVTDALGKADKQINDIEDLYAKGIDILLVRACTEAGLDPIISRLYKEGLPVITISKGITSDNYTSFVSASNVTMGRMQVIWLAEMLKGEGNIVVLSGWAGSGSVKERWIGGNEALSQYPGIKILDRQYTQYSASKGKEVMQAMIQSFGDKIDAVWCDAGDQGAGALEALHEAGMVLPITGNPVNSFMKRSVQWNYPAFAPGYPVTMGADSVKLALKVLQGIPVPKRYNCERVVLTTHETADIKTDMPYEKGAVMDKPDSWFFKHNLPEKWLPN